MLQTVLVALTAGLLGSAHCVGMCGGFVAVLGFGASPRAVALRQAAYFTGKTATYATFGGLAGGLGEAVGAALGAFGGGLGVALGLTMVGVGVGLCGGARAPGARFAAGLAPALGRLVRSGSVPSLVGLGALNGLLPCGLVYGMLAVAASSGSALGGGVTMAAFGLATLPALALTGALGARLRPTRRLQLQRLAGVLVVAMGLLTVARGAEALVPTPAAAPAEIMCLPGG